MSVADSIVSQFTPGAAGVWTGVFMLAAWMAREWRETRKLSIDDRLARREGYAAQVEGLQAENRQLRYDMISNEQRHTQARQICQQETDQLRDQVVKLENRLAGVMRKVADVAIRAARGEFDATLAASVLQLAAEMEPSGQEHKP